MTEKTLFPMPLKKPSKSKKKARKLPGHYCRVCGRRRANEKFSGKGHAAHICKDCTKEQRAEAKKKRRIAAAPRAEKNFFSDLPTSLSKELIENIFQTEHVRIERIVSTGQSSPPGFWYDQPEGEWVILLRGGATLEFQGESRMQRLSPGDYVYIPPHRKHRVFSTSATQTTVWLAVFVEESQHHPSNRELPVMPIDPDPTVTHPVPGFPVTYVKPTITRPNIIVGEFTYYSGEDFESRVTHHYDFCGDRLIIGKFCQIAAGVEFVMNGANHKMNAASTFPFYILEGWKQDIPPLAEMPHKGDTIVGNDVWIGQNAVILPGVRIGDGVIIGLNSVVGSDIEPYSIVAGNPAKLVRKRFDDELIALLQAFKWWDRPVDEIQELIPLLANSDLERVKKEIKARVCSGYDNGSVCQAALRKEG